MSELKSGRALEDNHPINPIQPWLQRSRDNVKRHNGIGALNLQRLQQTLAGALMFLQGSHYAAQVMPGYESRVVIQMDGSD